MTTTCPICLDDITLSDTDVQFDCLHRFHADCWHEHLLKRPKDLGYMFFCPVCRYDVGKVEALRSMDPNQRKTFELRVHDQEEESANADNILFDWRQYLFFPDIVEEYAVAINLEAQAVRELLHQSAATIITRRV